MIYFVNAFAEKIDSRNTSPISRVNKILQSDIHRKAPVVRGILVIFHSGFEGRALVLIASVPGHCLPFTFFLDIAYPRLCHIHTGCCTEVITGIAESFPPV